MSSRCESYTIQQLKELPGWAGDGPEDWGPIFPRGNGRHYEYIIEVGIGADGWQDINWLGRSNVLYFSKVTCSFIVQRILEGNSYRLCRRVSNINTNCTDHINCAKPKHCQNAATRWKGVIRTRLTMKLEFQQVGCWQQNDLQCVRKMQPWPLIQPTQAKESGKKETKNQQSESYEELTSLCNGWDEGIANGTFPDLV